MGNHTYNNSVPHLWCVNELEYTNMVVLGMNKNTSKLLYTIQKRVSFFFPEMHVV
jgi:hypothetical protein